MSEQTSMTRQDMQATNNPQNQQGNPEEKREMVMVPPVDVIESATAITLLADLPGVPRDKLNIQLEPESLTIEGEVSLAMPEGMESSHAEVRLARYRRVFSLSRELDTENTSAEFKNGVLRLHIPKAPHLQPRKIEVRAG
ncbi:MAG: Hsp20/alpha crystallin family protein [Herminiimonas sp.]|nr:Hsp20/alpha crystallin family protein [Herminiimonas sp.]